MAYYTITANTPQGRDIIARSQQGTAEERVQERLRRGDFSAGGDGSRERQRDIEAARKKEAYYDERAKLLLSGGSFQGYQSDKNWLESGLSSITGAITPLSVMGLAGGAALAGVGSGAGAGGAAEAATVLGAGSEAVAAGAIGETTSAGQVAFGGAVEGTGGLTSAQALEAVSAGGATAGAGIAATQAGGSVPYVGPSASPAGATATELGEASLERNAVLKALGSLTLSDVGNLALIGSTLLTLGAPQVSPPDAPTMPEAPPAREQEAKTPDQDVFTRKRRLAGDPTALTGAGGIPFDQLIFGKPTVL